MTTQKILYGVVGLFLFLVGMALAPNYGIPMDEPTMHQLALHTHDFLAGDVPWTSDPAYRYHGPLVEFGILSVQKLFNFTHMPSMVVARHTLTFLFFIVTVIATGLLSSAVTRTKWIGIAGALCMILSPRLFGEAFVNSRDIPFMAIFTVSMLLLVYGIRTNRWGWFVFCGILSGAALAIRTMGIFIPCIVIASFFVTSMHSNNVPWRRNVMLALVYLAVLSMTTIALWPLLWSNPVVHFSEALFFSSSFTETPLTTVLAWIGTTTPIPYLLLACIGVYVALRELRSEQLVLLLWLIAPLSVFVFTSAGIYNGWRHLYFLYPAIIVLGMIGFHVLYTKIAKSHKAANTLCIGGGIYLVLVLLWMVRAHPLEYIYFNALQRSETVEKDYWGLSTKIALETIAEQDERNVLGIYATNRIAFYNAYAFFPKRLFFAAQSDATAQYIIDTGTEQHYKARMPSELLILEITVGNHTAARVYKGPGFGVQPEKDPEEIQREIESRPRPPWTYGAWIR